MPRSSLLEGSAKTRIAGSIPQEIAALTWGQSMRSRKPRGFHDRVATALITKSRRRLPDSLAVQAISGRSVSAPASIRRKSAARAGGTRNRRSSRNARGVDAGPLLGNPAAGGQLRSCPDQ